MVTITTDIKKMIGEKDAITRVGKINFTRIKMPSAVITLVKFIFPTLVIASILFTVFSL